MKPSGLSVHYADEQKTGAVLSQQGFKGSMQASCGDQSVIMDFAQSMSGASMQMGRSRGLAASLGLN